MYTSYSRKVESEWTVGTHSYKTPECPDGKAVC